MAFEISKNIRFYNINITTASKARYDYYREESVQSDQEKPGLQRKIEAFARRNQIGSSNGVSADRPTSLSLRPAADDTTYVVRIQDRIRTAFSSNPITILPPELNNLISHVGLLKPGTGDEVQFVEPSSLGGFDPDLIGASLTFRCNRAEMLDAWQQAMPVGHKGFPLAIPFFLNLYDTETGMPVWTTQQHSPNAHQPLFHGGIHPDSVTQLFYYP